MTSRKRVKQGLKVAEAALSSELESWRPLVKCPPRLGDRIQILTPHPWGGHAGRVIGFGQTAYLPHIKVRLDDGTVIFVIDRLEWKPDG